MPLTDLQIRQLRPKDKPYKKSHKDGLYILVHPNGSKYWRLAFRFNRKQKTLPIGVYPDVTFREAKIAASEARTQLDNNIDPCLERKLEKINKDTNTENTFKAISREWHARHSDSWSAAHCKKLLARLENDVFPWLGDRPIAEIKPPELLTVIRRIENRGALDSAHRTLQTCGQIFRYGVATGRAEIDVCRDLKGALPPVAKDHFSAITEPEELAPLLRDMRAYSGSLITKTAMTMLPYVFVRPGELRRAEWKEIDFEEATWTIPAEKMKMKAEHIVPLATQVVALLQELHPLTGKSDYVFHGARSVKRPMSENTILAALRNLGYTKEQVTPHGFRATARTLLDEVLDYPAHLIEHQSAHAVKDANGRAYNRTKHLPQRQEMMQVWADYLDGLTENH